MQDPLHRLWKTKLTLLATVTTVGGIAVLILAHWASTNEALAWLAALPTTEVGSALFTTGLIAIFFEYIDTKDADERATNRLRAVLAEEAPAIRDAVVQPASYGRTASPTCSAVRIYLRMVTPWRFRIFPAVCLAIPN